MGTELVRYPGGATRSADAEDCRFDLIPAEPHLRLARRYAVGAKIHGDHNWKNGMPTTTILNHLEKHLTLWKQGDRTDDHLAAATWGLYALMYYEAHPLPTKRRSPWKARNVALREAAAQTWEYLYQEPMPAHITLRWRTHLGDAAGRATIGALHSGGRIDLEWGAMLRSSNPLATLVHEFGHCRGWEKHTKKFEARVVEWCRKLGIEG